MGKQSMKDIAESCTRIALANGAKEAGAAVSRVRDVTLIKDVICIELQVPQSSRTRGIGELVQVADQTALILQPARHEMATHKPDAARHEKALRQRRI